MRLPQKWTVLRSVYRIAILALLVWISVLASQTGKLLELGIGMITQNQVVMDQKADIHNKQSCKETRL